MMARKATFGALALGAIAMGLDVADLAHHGGAEAWAAATAVAEGHQDNALFDVAGGEVPFWANMVKYARFSISIMVGFAFMFGRPIVALLKKPQTAIAVVALGTGGFYFFRWTLETMLAMNDPSSMGY